MAEMLTDGSELLETGMIRRFDFVVDDVEAYIATVKVAGYKMFIKLKEICLEEGSFLQKFTGGGNRVFCQRW